MFKISYIFFILVLLFSAVDTMAECIKVADNDILHSSVIKHLKQETKSDSIIVRVMIKNGDLLLVEYESKDFEPLIELIMQHGKKLTTIDQWGGALDSQEGPTKQVVLMYFKSNNPMLDIDGLGCYEPMGPPFLH